MGSVKKCGGQEWENVWNECGKVCWSMGEVRGEVWGEGKDRCGGVKKCGRVYGVSVEGVGKCAEVSVYESVLGCGRVMVGGLQSGELGLRELGSGGLGLGKLGSGELGSGVGVRGLMSGELESRRVVGKVEVRGLIIFPTSPTPLLPTLPPLTPILRSHPPVIYSQFEVSLELTV